jgi:hypothetical protein
MKSPMRAATGSPFPAAMRCSSTLGRWLNEGDGAEGVVYDDLTLPANPGTSPSVASGYVSLSGGSSDVPYADAFNFPGWQDTTEHRLLVYENNPNTGEAYASTPSGAVLAQGTSPGVASSYFFYYNPGNGFEATTSELEAALQGSNGDLFTALSPGTSDSSTAMTHIDTGLAMATGSSPAIG